MRVFILCFIFMGACAIITASANPRQVMRNDKAVEGNKKVLLSVGAAGDSAAFAEDDDEEEADEAEERAKQIHESAEDDVEEADKVGSSSHHVAFTIKVGDMNNVTRTRQEWSNWFSEQNGRYEEPNQSKAARCWSSGSQSDNIRVTHDDAKSTTNDGHYWTEWIWSGTASECKDNFVAVRGQCKGKCDQIRLKCAKPEGNWLTDEGIKGQTGWSSEDNGGLKCCPNDKPYIYGVKCDKGNCDKHMLFCKSWRRFQEAGTWNR